MGWSFKRFYYTDVHISNISINNAIITYRWTRFDIPVDDLHNDGLGLLTTFLILNLSGEGMKMIGLITENRLEG